VSKKVVAKRAKGRAQAAAAGSGTSAAAAESASPVSSAGAAGPHGQPWNRVAIERLSPRIDGGRFPIKRIAGDPVAVEAAIVADGHELVSAVVLHRRAGEEAWTEIPMEPLGEDRFLATFTVGEPGRHVYTVMGWVDRYRSWARDLGKRLDAGQDVSVELLIGVGLIESAAVRATGPDRESLAAAAAMLRSGGAALARAALDPGLASLMVRYGDRPFAAQHQPDLEIVVDRERARFSAWYELFPRSAAVEPGRHGTLRDVEARLPAIAEMGFDVLYLPPIHPIGRVNRKGPNNTPDAAPGDPGSPWAIGSAEGGHKAVHPALGTLDDLRHLREAAAAHGLELALDIAFQCAPDHPYATEHPEWFRLRPDGTIQYAENPPKKYQDIYPFDFETPAWRALWDELASVVRFWAEQGIRIFRVDNPHTKPFDFWEWLIADIKRDYPEAIFLAEAFTRPKVMYRLAKLGFTQSYNYFPWRNTRAELTDYLTELTATEVREFFGPNLWPNTPDILPEYLQFGGPPAFMARAVLAATLGPSFGVYGPAFEQCVAEPLAPGREEYLDSEKYEIRHWDWDAEGSLSGLLARLNAIRRDNPAFRANHALVFHPVSNPELIAFSKASADGANQVLVVVNLDPHHVQSGFLELPLQALGLDGTRSYQVHDVLNDARYLWNGPRNYVELGPAQHQANVFVIRRWARSERDFDYYL
jgi:starch synthase (maltosyl-transferring)